MGNYLISLLDVATFQIGPLVTAKSLNHCEPLAKMLQHERGIEDDDAQKVQLVLQQIHAAKNKNERWRKREKKFWSFRSKIDEDEEMGKKKSPIIFLCRDSRKKKHLLENP
eukprot:Seg2479.5 transcript_id=Seg2479.5/GoldUCD/mRNA.D3Y31 product="hypothetical protein" protein_id=Seg2479.5/GoldUCD/D3Y31